jgi:membrane fusion protein (multidrug efflux system)
MFVQIRVPVDEPKSYLAVPATAIRRATYGDHVWVVVQDVAKGQNRATQRPVKLGPSVGEDVIVLEGLKAGERIATTGSFKLREGVLIKEPTAVADAAVAETSTQESKPKGNDVDH